LRRSDAPPTDCVFDPSHIPTGLNTPLQSLFYPYDACRLQLILSELLTFCVDCLLAFYR
jgi:hypothetical protein